MLMGGGRCGPVTLSISLCRDEERRFPFQGRGASHLGVSSSTPAPAYGAYRSRLRRMTSSRPSRSRSWPQRIGILLVVLLSMRLM